MNRRSRGRKRNPRNLTQLPRVSIITEGKETEPIYFSKYRNNRFQPVIINKVNPKHMIAHARNVKKGEDFRPKEGDQVWLVFDKDNLKDSEVQELFVKAKEENIRIAYSKPCFEIWFLLHFRFDDTNYNNAELVEKLSDMTKSAFNLDFKKSEDYFQHFLPLREKALINADQLVFQRTEETGEEVHKMGTVTTAGNLVRELMTRIPTDR